MYTYVHISAWIESSTVNICKHSVHFVPIGLPQLEAIHHRMSQASDLQGARTSATRCVKGTFGFSLRQTNSLLLKMDMYGGCTYEKNVIFIDFP